jgi:hypothetical protein
VRHLGALIVALATAFACEGCGTECGFFIMDESRARCVSKYGSDIRIRCYSDGAVVFEDVSRGETMNYPAYTLYVRKATGRHARVTGQCTFEPVD